MKSKKFFHYLIPAIVLFGVSSFFWYGIHFTDFKYLFIALQGTIKSWYPHGATAWLLLRAFVPPILTGTLCICFTYLSVCLLAVLLPYAVKKKKEMLVAVVAIFIALFLAEIGLRTAGYQPGQMNNLSSFRPVDTLILEEGYLADANGMTYINPAVSSKIRKTLKNSAKPENKNLFAFFGPKQDQLELEFESLPNEYRQVLNLSDKSTFTNFYAGLLHQKKLDATDSLVINYVHAPINSCGFRSIEFRKKSTRKRILLIGDSFTYGFTTSNKVHSFYDLLLTAGFEVYNTGLNDSDPPQYAAVARKYIPLLKPDVVIVNFYMGNDVHYFHQQFKPFQTYCYRTNAGFLQACPLGVPALNMQDGYQLAHENSCIPENDSWFNKCCSQSVITTLLWNFLNEKYHFSSKSKKIKAFEQEAKKHHLDYPDANDRMCEIRQLCETRGSSFILSIIPSLSSDGKRNFVYVNSDKKLFTQEKFVEPHTFLETDYCTGTDGHFNESGHQKYAAFLKSVLDSVLSARFIEK